MRYWLLCGLLLLYTTRCNAEEYRLDGDTDRTGKVDGTAAERALKPTQTVIVLNNCDDSDGDGIPDNLDNRINGPADREQLEPIIIRKIAGLPKGQLSVSIKKLSNDDVPDEKRIRVFKDDRTPIIGPATRLKYVLNKQDLTTLQMRDLTLLVEGLAFATSVHLSLNLDGKEQDYVNIEVAPFLLTPHDQEPEKNYVVEDKPPVSRQYVANFKTACKKATVKDMVVSSSDIWIQDEFRWGYTETPRLHMPVALHMPRFQGLQSHVRKLLARNVGYATPFDFSAPLLKMKPDSIHFGGNLQVTPPTADFPFGRVYYGSIKSQNLGGNTYNSRAIDRRIQDFFKRQKVQLPIDLTTDWLSVGHVDEIITFLPNGRGKSLALLLASPKLALQVINPLPPNTPLHLNYLNIDLGLSTMNDLLSFGQLQLAFDQYNLAIDRKIFGMDHARPDPNSIKGRLKAALKLQEAEIHEVPVLYFNSPESPALWAAVALTPAMINLSSMGKFTLVPEPFLLKFKQRVTKLFQTLGNTPIWIDTWEVFHLNGGEVHCGSNVYRRPFSKKWWQK